MLCDYGCGQEAKYQFKNGKWCCSKNCSSCVEIKRKNKEANLGRIPSKETRKKLRKSLRKYYSVKENRNKQSLIMKKIYKEPTKRENISLRQKNRYKDKNERKKASINALNRNNIIYKRTIKKINKKYPFFSKIEEMRYNPDKPGEKEIQVHCKNHNCPNSKEKGSWFTPAGRQIESRIYHIERGNGGCYFYCSQHCKYICPLYYLNGDPYKDNNLPYTYVEYQACRAVVFDREKGLCEYCGEPVTDMHHIFPVKKEPFFALDPDYCVACCEKHHYKYAHKDECSTGNLSKIVCSVESQKFLNQELENV